MSRDLKRPKRALLALAALGVGAGAALPGAAAADHGLTYEGHYGNAFVAGRSDDGRDVAVMGGFHADFPYHDPGSGYDQIAVYVEGRQPIVATKRPKSKRFRLTLGERRTTIRYRERRVRLELDFKSVEHPPLYEGDPADLGDRALELGLGGYSDRRPGFVYVPYELQRLTRGEIVLIERRHGTVQRFRVRLRRMTGQAEAGTIEAPDDARFRSAYDYIAVAPVSGPGYAYVGFETHALHSGADGALGPYFAATASDEFTMQRGSFSDGNVRGAPVPFDNTAGAVPGTELLARFDVDLGPGILHRALVSSRDGRGARVIALSETIVEDRGGAVAREGAESRPIAEAARDRLMR